MNKYENCYCDIITILNLMTHEDVSHDFIKKVQYPITEILFNYMTENEPEFANFLKEGLDEII